MWQKSHGRAICRRTTEVQQIKQYINAADQHRSIFQGCAPCCTHLACVAGVSLPQHCMSIAGHHLARLERGPHKILGLLHSGIVPKLQQVQSHAQAAALNVAQPA